MLKDIVRKVISMVVLAVTLITVSPICANAEWIDGNSKWQGYGLDGAGSRITGWWYKEGNSYAVGWRQIYGNWYYFDSQGYMRVGWTMVDGKWYYLDSDGKMLSNTVKDGYILAVDGHWDENADAVEQKSSFSYEKALELSKNMGISGYDTIVTVNREQKFDHFENKPYYYVIFTDKSTGNIISSCELFEDGSCIY